jgi:branched-chain amino acid transport system ATP-binding protein
MSAALETSGLHKRFGGVAATRDVSLSVEPGARHALIGPNGAGKTTLINLLTGVLRPDAGTIRLDGIDITGLPTHARVRRGVARTFQVSQLFADFTPLQTVTLAISERRGHGAQWWRTVGDDRAIIDEATALLERFSLIDARDQRVATLPYGRRRLLEIATAIASGPRLLLLDEPAAGVPEDERRDILASIDALPEHVAVLLIEHDMDLVFSFARRISVLVDGALLVEGAPQDVARDAAVRRAYLGESGHG